MFLLVILFLLLPLVSLFLRKLIKNEVKLNIDHFLIEDPGICLLYVHLFK